MERIQFGEWVIDIDIDKTKEFYDKHHLITDDCNCDYCANFVIACDKFPQKLREFFDLFGINPRKEGEVFQYDENQDGMNLYGAFYHIVGKIIDCPLGNDTIRLETETAAQNQSEAEITDFYFTRSLALVPNGFPEPTIQLELELSIPWVLRK